MPRVKMAIILYMSDWANGHMAFDLELTLPHCQVAYSQIHYQWDWGWWYLLFPGQADQMYTCKQDGNKHFFHKKKIKFILNLHETIVPLQWDHLSAWS